MTREDQRLMLVGSALTGIMAQHLSQTTESNLVHVDAAHFTDDQLADAALKAVKVADLTLKAMGERGPSVQECMDTSFDACLGFVNFVAKKDKDGLLGYAAQKLLDTLEGTKHAL